MKRLFLLATALGLAADVIVAVPGDPLKDIRLQRDERRSVRRLHVLLYAGVLREQRELRLEDPAPFLVKTFGLLLYGP